MKGADKIKTLQLQLWSFVNAGGRIEEINPTPGVFRRLCAGWAENSSRVGKFPQETSLFSALPDRGRTHFRTAGGQSCVTHVYILRGSVAQNVTCFEPDFFLVDLPSMGIHLHWNGSWEETLSEQTRPLYQRQSRPVIHMM